MNNHSVVAEIKLSYQPTFLVNKPVENSKDVFDAVYKYFNKDTIALQESFIVMYLNQNNQIQCIHTHSVGGMCSTVVDIRLIFGIALKSAS
jgi:DNA repair protein RadC